MGVGIGEHRCRHDLKVAEKSSGEASLKQIAGKQFQYLHRPFKGSLPRVPEPTVGSHAVLA
jgi:hypothetical protein